MGRQREKERLLCGQPVCEEVGHAPVASQWASVNHMAPSLSPSSSPSLPLTLFLSQTAGWSVRLWPFTLVDRWDYYLPNTHFANTRQHSYQATLTVHCVITHKHNTHTHAHTRHAQAPSSAKLPCGQTKETTLCMNLISLASWWLKFIL